MIVSIQYLRGIAALLVLLSHISYKDAQYSLGSFHFDIGIFGVDIFFIISGFIMYYISLNVSNIFLEIYYFIKNRVIRIIPLYWMLSLMSLMVYMIAPERINSSTGATDVFNSFILFPSETRYLVAVGWTLSYEFYFYFIFSIALFFAHYRAAIVGVILLGLVLTGHFVEKSFYIDFFTNSLLLEFLYGILIAKLHFSGLLKSKNIIALGSFGLFVLFLFLYFLNHTLDIRGIDLGLPAMFLVLSLVMCENFFKNHKNMFFIQLGNMSYSLYLTHLFVLGFIGEIYKYFQIKTHLSEIIYILSMLGVSLTVGYLVYTLVEKKLLEFFKK